MSLTPFRNNCRETCRCSSSIELDGTPDREFRRMNRSPNDTLKSATSSDGRERSTVEVLAPSRQEIACEPIVQANQGASAERCAQFAIEIDRIRSPEYAYRRHNSRFRRTADGLYASRPSGQVCSAQLYRSPFDNCCRRSLRSPTDQDIRRDLQDLLITGVRPRSVRGDDRLHRGLRPD